MQQVSPIYKLSKISHIKGVKIVHRKDGGKIRKAGKRMRTGIDSIGWDGTGREKTERDVNDGTESDRTVHVKPGR